MLSSINCFVSGQRERHTCNPPLLLKWHNKKSQEVLFERSPISLNELSLSFSRSHPNNLTPTIKCWLHARPSWKNLQPVHPSAALGVSAESREVLWLWPWGWSFHSHWLRKILFALLLAFSTLSFSDPPCLCGRGRAGTDGWTAKKTKEENKIKCNYTTLKTQTTKATAKWLTSWRQGERERQRQRGRKKKKWTNLHNLNQPKQLFVMLK